MCRLKPWSAALLLVALCAAGTSARSIAQEKPARDEPAQDYIRFVPLSYPRLVEATAASEAFHLFGDPDDPDFDDVAPLNGIDDRRDPLLAQLGRRFVPILVRNTVALPMDLKYFWQGPLTVVAGAGGDSAAGPRDRYFPLYIDTWDVSGSGGRPLDRRTIDFGRLESSTCSPDASQGGGPDGSDADEPDCELLRLLEEFHPYEPRNRRARTLTSGAEQDSFRVLFFDFPGSDERSWRESYRDSLLALPEDADRFAKTYVHPFIVDLYPDSGLKDDAPRYELALQYWFFYPWNDGGNNHEGDWEHVNVVVRPMAEIDRAFSADDLRALLDGDREARRAFLGNDSERRLVIQRVEYYFHGKVMTLDYSRPNVYQDVAAWRNEVDEAVESRLGQRWLWERIRQLAYRNDEESPESINTNPIGYIGADNKGLDQLLSGPGGKNRDSHGTYPLPGLYKNVGPLGASEEIEAQFDHREYFSQVRARGGAWTSLFGPRDAGHGLPVPFDEMTTGVEVVPDWERLIDRVRTSPEARREWSWLVLPIRWGQPAAKSPAAGIVAHAETGNLSVVGPAFNQGWNRLGSSAGYAEYDPHRFPSLFALSWQDNFENELGILNLTGPTLVYLPPFDLLWRLVLAPLRVALGNKQQTFFPDDAVPFRLFGFTAGVSAQAMPDEFASLLLSGVQGTTIIEELLALDDQVLEVPRHATVQNAVSGAAQVAFFVGRRFVSENTLRHSRSAVGLQFALSGGAEPYTATADLNFWEWAGSLRYNLAIRNFQPFVKLGYGWSWYRLESMTADGEPLDPPSSEWVRQPSLLKLDNLLPNTWHFGGGIEVIFVNGAKPLPGGMDFGLRAEYGLFLHGLGLELPSELTALSANLDTGVARHSFIVALTLSF